jgi:hypothetical protein
MPVYFAVYLWKSPIARISAPGRGGLLSMEPIDVRCITGALTLGYIFPTILVALPSPSLVSPVLQRIFQVIWEFFSLLVALCQILLSVIVHFFDLVPESAQQSPATKIRYARRVYRYIIGIVVVVHFSTIALAVFPWIRPRFAPLGSTPIDLRDMFVPAVFSPHPVRSIAENSLLILQYDFYFSTASGLLWTTYMSYALSGPAAALKSAMLSLARSLVAGPGGAVLWAVWDRDEKVLAAANPTGNEKAH